MTNTPSMTGDVDDLVADMDHGRLLDIDVLRLARHPDEAVRAAVAEKLPFIMGDLSDDVDAVARMLARDDSDWVASLSHRMPNEVQQRLVDIPQLHVRLAERSDLDDATVHAIIDSGQPTAVDRLIDNPAVSDSLRVVAALSRNGTARSQPHDEESR